MGRMGHRLFEGDTDWDLESNVCGAIEKKLKARSVDVDSDHLYDLLQGLPSVKKKQSASHLTPQTLKACLDEGICDELFQEYKKEPDAFYGEYPVVILGAVMMRLGARISRENQDHLTQVAERAQCRAGFSLPIFDLGFRNPGKAQFLAAVAHYMNGKPRDFHGPSCFSCGRINDDIAPAKLSHCGRCKQAWYCDRDCQKKNWKGHKLICRKNGEPPITAGGYGMLNV